MSDLACRTRWFIDWSHHTWALWKSVSTWTSGCEKTQWGEVWWKNLCRSRGEQTELLVEHSLDTIYPLESASSLIELSGLFLLLLWLLEPSQLFHHLLYSTDTFFQYLGRQQLSQWGKEQKSSKLQSLQSRWGWGGGGVAEDVQDL